MTIPTLFQVISNAVLTAFRGGVRSDPYNPTGVGTPRWKTRLNASRVEAQRALVAGLNADRWHAARRATIGAHGARCERAMPATR